MPPKPWLKWVDGLLAASWLFNGAWMLFAPSHWFYNIPGASDTGPLNEHFVRDYGYTFLLMGGIVLLALARGTFTRGLHAVLLAFYAIHAGIHIWDLLAGRVPLHHAMRDFPLVFAPVIVLAVLALPFAWRREKLM